MKVKITFLASYATLDEARDARMSMSKFYDNLVIKFDCNTYKLIRYEVNSPVDALDTITEDTPSNYRNSAKSRKRKGTQSINEQLQFD